MPSPQQLLEVIRTQTQIAKQGLDLEAVMDLVVHDTVQLLQVDGAAIELAEGDAMVYRAVAGLAKGQLGLRLRRDASLSGLCVRDGMVLECGDTRSDPRVDRAACERMGIRSMVVVPLQHSGTCVGVLKAMAAEPQRFGRPERTLLSLLSDAVAAAMFFAHQYGAGDLFHLATHDRLTNLANRALFLERLQTLVEAHQRPLGALAVLRLRIDGLQAVNKSHGQQAGDALIQACAQRLQRLMGEQALVARLGGDDFAVLLPHADSAVALQSVIAAIDEALQAPVPCSGWLLRLASGEGRPIRPAPSPGEGVGRVSAGSA